MKQKTPPKFKRRNYYIDQKFQTDFIIKFWLIVAVGSVCTAIAIYWLSQTSTTVAIVNGRVAVHSTSEFLLPLMIQTVQIELIIVSLATALMTLFISHKIAGPMFRIKATLTALGQGNLAKMHLREGDQLQEIAVVYNDAVSSINDKIRMIQDAKSLEEAKKIANTFKVL